VLHPATGRTRVSVADLPERGVRWFDELQQRHRWIAQPVGVIKKYGDDRGSALAGLVTYSVFLGMLPLLVVALTVLGGVLEGSERLRDAVLDSTLSQLPVIGQRIEEDVSALSISGPWLIIAIAGLVWSSFGIYHNLQLAQNLVWNVEGQYHQGFVSRHLRALLLYVMLFVAAVGPTFIPDLSFLRIGPGVVSEVGPLVFGSLVASVLLLGVFRITTAPVVRTGWLVPAAIAAGIFWESLQRLGSWIVSDRLLEAEDLYGAIGLVVVTLFWINLLARSLVFANEVAVVSRRRLWPRRIAQPPLSEADKRVLEALVLNERRRPELVIDVSFVDPSPTDAGAEPAAEGAAGEDLAGERDPDPRP